MARRRRNAFIANILRGIRSSLGRFIAIVGITALGCGFFAGLKMCGPDMRSAADDLYDGTNLYDIRVLSSLGFTEDDVSRLSAAAGVDGSMAAITCDAMARMGKEQVAVRISTLDVDSAEGGQEQGANAILSSDANYLNRIFLREGRWPKAAGECVISADASVANTHVGDDIRLLYGVDNLDDIIDARTLKVVGLVSSSSYPYTGSFGSTTLGSGHISDYVYVSPSTFKDDAVFTEIYLRVKDAHEFESGSDKYEDAVEATKQELEKSKFEIASARLEDVQEQAQKKLDKNAKKLKKAREDAKKELEDARKELDEAKQKVKDGESELAKGKAEYENGVRQLESQRAAAERQLADAQAQLDDAAATIASKEAELANGQAEYDRGKAEFDQRLAEALAQMQAPSLEAAKSSLLSQRDAAQQGLDAATTAHASAQQIVDGRAQVAAREAELAQARTALNAGTSEFLGALAAQGIGAASLAEAKSALVQTIASMQAAGASEQELGALRSALAQCEQLLASESEVSQGEAAVAQAKTDMDSAEAQLVAGLSAQGVSVANASEALPATQQLIDEAQAGIARIDEGLSGVYQLEEVQATLASSAEQIEDGKRQLAEGRAKLESGRAELQTKRDQAYAQMDDAEAKLRSAKAQLESGTEELEDGRKKYEEGLAEYEKGKKEADDELEKAQRQLDDGQKKLDEMDLPEIYFLDRSQNEGTLTYDSDSRRMDSIANVFPVIFFLVAALVSLTTMTRMVDDDRVEIGTFKALGYSTTQIALKYLLYAGAASLAGAVLGIAILSQVLPIIVTSSYGIIYAVPLHPFPLPINLDVALMSGGLGIAVTLGATWLAVVSSLRESPSLLMLPRAPAAGKRILLERIAPVWKRMSFSWKVTCRNLFRYKRRLAMTVIGISGCTALLLVGFGLHDAIWTVIDGQYGPIIHYNTTIALKSDADELDVQSVVDYLKDTGEAEGTVRLESENMQAGVSKDGEMLRVQVMVPQDASRIRESITFRDRLSGQDVAFDDDSVVVTEKLAMKYGLGVGDDVLLFDQDAIGNTTGEGHALTIDDIVENYVGNIVYAGRDAWGSISDEEPVFSTILCSVTEDEDVRNSIASDLRERDDVSTVAFSDEDISKYRNMLNVVDFIVVVLIVSAGLLAAIVLFNLTNINISERIREIASLKVLGFTRGEVYAYIFREIGILSIIGDALGLVLGTYLATFVITTAEVDYVMFGRAIHPLSYVWSFAITMGFTALVLLLMRKKLDRVNMVESLKSVD